MHTVVQVQETQPANELLACRPCIASAACTLPSKVFTEHSMQMETPKDLCPSRGKVHNSRQKISRKLQSSATCLPSLPALCGLTYCKMQAANASCKCKLQTQAPIASCKLKLQTIYPENDALLCALTLPVPLSSSGNMGLPRLCMVACSYAYATRNSVPSSKGRPSSCSPVGRPAPYASHSLCALPGRSLVAVTASMILLHAVSF